MSNDTLEAKIALIQKKLSNIESVLAWDDGMENAGDAWSVMTHSLVQVGERLNEIDEALLGQYDLLTDAKDIERVRHAIVHDEESVDLALMTKIIEDHLPELKHKLEMLRAALAKRANR